MLVLTRKTNQSIMIGDDVEVTVLAVVEGALERRGLAGPAAPAPAATAAPGPCTVVVIAFVVLLGLRAARGLLGGAGLLGLALLLGQALLLGAARGLGLELGGDDGVVLGAQVDLLVGVSVAGLAALGGRLELLLALERDDLLDRNLELMGDPGVGAALAHPRADLIELGAERPTGHRTAGETSASAGEACSPPGDRTLGSRPHGGSFANWVICPDLVAGRAPM